MCTKFESSWFSLIFPFVICLIRLELHSNFFENPCMPKGGQGGPGGSFFTSMVIKRGLKTGFRKSKPSGGKISNKVFSQNLVHFMQKYIKVGSFEALKVGFLGKNFSFRELRLITIITITTPTLTTLRHAWIFKIFGVEL